VIDWASLTVAQVSVGIILCLRCHYAL